MNFNFDAENQIEITQYDNPHKFWYKKCNDLVENRRLQQLEDGIAKYVADVIEWQEDQLPIVRGDEVAFLHPVRNKWIRGKAGKLKSGSKTDIFVWAIDYGCMLVVPLKNVHILQDRLLAFKPPINVHIGGLSDISPAKMDFNINEMQTEIVRCDSWTRESIEQFKDCIGDRKFVTFHVERFESGRNFGHLVLHSEDGGNNTFCVANGLCKWGVAIQDRNYDYDICPLDREDFLRLNHQMAFRGDSDNEMTIEDDKAAQAERIFLDDETLSSIDLELEQQSGQEDGTHGNRSQNPCASHVSSSMAISGINGNSLSEETNTLSVKLLNKLNVLIITSDEITPVERWEEMSYFTSQAKTFLQRIYKNEIDRTCSYGWPHVMRTNSLLLIGEPVKNLTLCLPTVCSVKQSVSTWSTSHFLEPIAIIFVTCAEEVELMAKYCRKMIQSSGLNDMNVFCLSSSFEMKTLTETAKDGIDILVAPVFCFETIVQHMPKLAQRLRYVWFHQIDEMCRINVNLTKNAVDQLLLDHLDIQVVTSSKTYCPILHDIFDRAKIPMISIGERTPFEAALFANCHFVLIFEDRTEKIKRMIIKLQHRLNGSIVIMCANQTEVKFVTGHLTQANIKCIDLDDQYSRNQMKLLKWSKQCLAVDGVNIQSSSHLNILVCDDASLEKFPIRSAQHLIHYSLPQKLQTFTQRYITCYAFYEDRLRRKLLYRENDLPRPVSHVYFDDQLTDDYIEVFELLLKRTRCQPPPDLVATVQQMRFNFEGSKLKPLCGELITRSVDCDMQCPYRHTLFNNLNDTYVPEYGYVNMELLGVLAPNHFAVRVIGHKRCREHKSKSIEDLNTDWEQFDRNLREHYANVSRENHGHIEIGDMCLIFHQSQPKRCRVISIDSKHISVYLVDIGRIRRYAPHQLYRLDDEFLDFPTQAIEIYVLGYLPADCSPKWLPEAKDYVEQMMRQMKEKRKTQNYLQAELIKGFERTLIVKDLNILFKGKNQLSVKSVGRKLIKSGFASEMPIVLHDIFMVHSDNNSSDGDTQIDSEIIDHTVPPTYNSRYAMQLSPTPSSDGIQVTSLELCENPPVFVMVPPMKKKRNSDTTTPASLDDYIDAETVAKDLNEPEWDEVDATAIYDCTQVVCTIAENQFEPIQAPVTDDIDVPFIDFGTQVDANGEIIKEPECNPFNLDDIFGSLPESIQATDVLQPIRCYSNDPLSNGIEETKNENTVWLIDFSD